MAGLVIGVGVRLWVTRGAARAGARSSRPFHRQVIGAAVGVALCGVISATLNRFVLADRWERSGAVVSLCVTALCAGGVALWLRSGERRPPPGEDEPPPDV